MNERCTGYSNYIQPRPSTTHPNAAGIVQRCVLWAGSLNPMTQNKIITSAVLSAFIAAGGMLPLATSASANDWNRGGYGQRNGHVQQYNRWDNGHYNHGYRRHRDHTGRNIAIGAFAAILGLAIAAETSKVQHDYYDND